MRYDIRSGVQQKKVSMKKMIIGGVASLATVGVIAAPTFAASPVVSDNANSNACFGQARASYAKGGPNGVLAPNNNGYYISQRQGDNPANNAYYIATYCN